MASVRPPHLAFTLPAVVDVVADVLTARLPDVRALAVPLALLVLALVDITVGKDVLGVSAMSSIGGRVTGSSIGL